MEEKERWVPILGYSGYEISTHSRIKSFRKLEEGRILSTWKTSRGYVNVLLYRNRERCPNSIHRLIGITFIPNPLNKPQINHINAIKDDNRIENLEWVTASENVQHGYDNNLTARAFGERNGNAKLTINQVREIKGMKGKGLYQWQIAKMFNTSQTNIGRIFRGEQWVGV